MQRIVAARDEKTARCAFLLTGVPIEWPLFAIGSTLIGMIARILLPEVTDAELATPTIILELLPAGIAGIGLAYQTPNILELIFYAYTFAAAGLFFPMLGLLFCRILYGLDYRIANTRFCVSANRTQSRRGSGSFLQLVSRYLYRSGTLQPSAKISWWGFVLLPKNIARALLIYYGTCVSRRKSSVTQSRRRQWC